MQFRIFLVKVLFVLYWEAYFRIFTSYLIIDSFLIIYMSYFDMPLIVFAYAIFVGFFIESLVLANPSPFLFQPWTTLSSDSIWHYTVRPFVKPGLTSRTAPPLFPWFYPTKFWLMLLSSQNNFVHYLWSNYAYFFSLKLP